ncbi:hypothetical protein BCR35DRAFT_351573 [Leucosporidium creatinivorum]|uniref:Uncharacterized protein n=1 Tax=Leucosporidium creatinivorum TaxID=106004 RepID=A0A1Y2FPX0_9BASI|nr:hypothetical protein BCR35DRAFT_351573 [Leucosporidium creatinivorum]
MCWSNATLFYGLWVTTAWLNFAATAHKATRPTILAIDLIINRRRRGKLEIEGQEEKTTARQLPEEVWELVKDELARRGACMEGVWSSRITWSRTAEQILYISSLLSHHELTLPTTEMWHEDPKTFDEDLEAFSAIALLLHSTKPRGDAFPIAKTEGSHPKGYGFKLSTVFELSPEALVLPVNADRRFRRLVSKYRLHAVDRTKSTVCALDEDEAEEWSTASENTPRPT